GATALVIGALLLGLGAALWQAASARRHAAAAQREALHARAVQGFLGDIFRSNSDRQADPALARNTTARELLDLGASRLSQTLQDAPEARAEVLAMLGEMYYQLELDEQAADLDGQLVALRRQLHGARHLRVAEALVHLAGSLHATGRRDQILPALQEAESILDELAEGQTPLRAELLSRLSQRHYNLSQTRSRHYAERAVVAWRAQAEPDLDHLSAALVLAARVHASCGEFGQAARLYHEAQTEMARMKAPSLVGLPEARLSLAEVLCQQMKTDEALALARLGVEQTRAALGETAPASVVAVSRWGGMLHARGQRPQGRELMETAVRLALQTRGENDTMQVPLTRANLARAWFAEGRVSEALALMQQVNDGAYRRHYAGSVVLAMGLRSEAAMRAALGQLDAARALLDEALDLAQRGSGGCWQAWRFNRMHLDHARIALWRGDAAQALVHLQRVVAPREIDIPAPQPELIEHAALAALAHQALGDSALAVATADAVWPDIARLATVARHPNVEADAALAVGKVWMWAGRLQQAHHALQHALALRIEFDHASSPWIAEAQVGLARWHDLSAQPDAAAALRASARQLLATFSMQDSPFHAQLAAGPAGVQPGWPEAVP
ncbi:MAG TPA: tetratricopeptide repeat protein, partial [Rubrivivax sp.]|nr:tetratricopeptide repeat protein [Rubrivivax sp.]